MYVVNYQPVITIRLSRMLTEKNALGLFMFDRLLHLSSAGSYFIIFEVNFPESLSQPPIMYKMFLNTIDWKSTL